MATDSEELKKRGPNWDDLRIVFALSQAGKAAKAAEALGIDSSTVLRRVKNLEIQLGVSLFHMVGHEHVETEIGKCVTRAAERMAAEVRTMERQLEIDAPLIGSLRIMMSEDLAVGIFDPSMAVFCRRHPGVRLDFIMQSRNVSLAHLEADVAVQTVPPREGVGEWGKKLCDIAWSCYASPRYVQQQGMPAEELDLEHRVILAPSDRAQVWRWLQKLYVRIHPLRSTSLFTLRQMALNHLGVAILPCFVGEYDADLMRVFPPIRDLSEELWIVCHQDLRRTSRVQAFFDIFGRLEPEVLARVRNDERLPPRTRSRQNSGDRGIAPHLPRNEN